VSDFFDQLTPLISEEQIQTKIKELGLLLKNKFKETEPVAICTLSGSFMFYSDLIRAIDIDLSCEFLGVSSYKNQKVSSGEVAVTLDIETPLKGKDIILIEDMVDSGLTMNFLINSLKARNPKSLTTVALLSKPKALKVPVQLDYVGFEIGNEFIVGYGIDYAGLYRNLPYVAILPEKK
jgi:hypoxanthine phosphoribosyltransferase